MSADYKIIAKPNCSLSSRGMKVVIGIIALTSFSIGLAFSVMGAWMVLPFAGLEIALVAYAFYCVNQHAQDFESITIQGDELAIEKKELTIIRRTVFNRHWAKVVVREYPSGDHGLFIRSHGKEVSFGKRFLNDEQRIALAEQLKRRIGDVY